MRGILQTSSCLLLLAILTATSGCCFPRACYEGEVRGIRGGRMHHAMHSGALKERIAGLKQPPEPIPPQPPLPKFHPVPTQPVFAAAPLAEQ